MLGRAPGKGLEVGNKGGQRPWEPRGKGLGARLDHNVTGAIRVLDTAASRGFRGLTGDWS